MKESAFPISKESILEKMNKINDLIVKLQTDTTEKGKKLINEEAAEPSYERQILMRASINELLDTENKEYKKYADEWYKLAKVYKST